VAALAATTGPVASCSKPSPIDRAPGVGGPEVIGRGVGARLWGSIQARQFPLRSGKGEVKIVWHMTGHGPLKVAAYDSRDHRIPLAWGPEVHGGSDYDRPGQEWGAGYLFTQPGGYRLTAQRINSSVEVWLHVAPPSN
jgi:hypothetical protein